MKTVMPDYYSEFQCIADRCQHSCCVGWEIDVDAQAQRRYQQVPGPLGEELRQKITGGDCPHFQLTEDERCPFLNEQNLCRLILNLGESSLCQICADHPRFRNYFGNRTEIGLGLCCEAAGALILGRKEKMTLVIREEDGEEETPGVWEQVLLAVRSTAFEIVQDRTLTMDERVQELLDQFGVQMPAWSMADWAGFFLTLERLDESWNTQLEQLCRVPPQTEELSPRWEIPLEQLLVYFLYRHVPSAQDETELRAYLAFAVLSYQVIRQLCQLREENGGCRMDDLVELARLYSSEIEYCEDNTSDICNVLWAANEEAKDTEDA